MFLPYFMNLRLLLLTGKEKKKASSSQGHSQGTKGKNQREKAAQSVLFPTKI